MVNNTLFRFCFTIIALICTVGCKNQNNDYRLIVIDEFINAGYTMKFYIGCDSVSTFDALTANNFQLDKVDSHDIFIIGKSEFMQLAGFFSSEDSREKMNIDSVAKVNPRIIRIRCFNSVTSISNEYLEDRFQFILSEKLKVIDLGKSKEGARLISELRQHSFL